MSLSMDARHGIHAERLLRPLATTEPATYAWLYRNDRVWLQAISTGHSQRASPHAEETGQRATNCSVSAEGGFNWMSLHPHGHPTLAMLCTEGSGLRQVLSVLHKLLSHSWPFLRRVSSPGQRRRPSPQSQSTLVGFGDGS